MDGGRGSKGCKKKKKKRMYQQPLEEGLAAALEEFLSGSQQSCVENGEETITRWAREEGHSGRERPWSQDVFLLCPDGSHPKKVLLYSSQGKETS